MATFKANRLMVSALLSVYLAWWTYVIYFFYCKEYDSDSGNAAYYATMAMITITAVLVLFYAGIFLLEAKRDRESRKLFLFATGLLLLPLAGIAVVEGLRSSYALLQAQ